MVTTTQITTQPESGIDDIDALLNSNTPGWAWLAAVHGRTTLYYTFSLAGGNASDVGSILNGAAVAFNASQQTAAVQALARITDITGIVFAATADGTQADLHFAAADIIGASTSGIASSTRGWSSSNGNVTSYTAESYIYLDNVQFNGSNANPSPGSSGFEVLLHEVGHAMGLKHPFEGAVQLPDGEDNTSNTLMSYTHVGGPYTDFGPYDVEALLFLYGDDGLGGDGIAAGGGGGGNTPPTGGVAVGGTVQQGSLLTVADTLADADGLGARSYAWQSSSNGTTWSTIAGATGSTYTPGQDQVGKHLRVVASYTDGDGNAESATSAQTAKVANVDDDPTGSVQISGTVRQNSPLTAGSTLADADGLGTLSYTWQSSTNGQAWTDIAGATGSSYTPGSTQVGKFLRVVVSYTDGFGAAESVPSAATATVAAANAAPTGSVTVTGAAVQGGVLSAQNTLADADGLGSVTYTWQSSGNGGSTWTTIAGATGSSVTLQQAQVGSLVRAVAAYTDGKGNAESVPSSASTAVQNVNDAPTGQLTLPTAVQQGKAIAVQSTLADADGLGSFAYRWQASADGTTWTDVAGATAASFAPTQAEVGDRLRVVVSYVDAQGSAESATSNATGAVANVNDPPAGSVGITGGTPMQGRTLTAVPALVDADGLGPVALRWQMQTSPGAWSDIADATDAAFTPGEAQVGKPLRVVASYTDGFGRAETVTGSVPGTVLNANDAPAGEIAIAGAAKVGRTIVASAGSLSDADGLGTITWQWQSSVNGSTWTAIAGATDAAFTVGSVQLGLQLRVLARYTDGHGSAESVASAPTAAVPSLVDGTAGDDTLSGSALADEIAGLAGNDRLSGGAGNDVLLGGDGIDTAVYARARADYIVGDGGTTVQATTGSEGSDTLAGVERLDFADRSLAFDLDGHAGTTARILGVVFGPASVANPLYAGIGLQLLDEGIDTEALMQMALEARLGPGFAAADEVAVVYQNLLGVAPTEGELAFWAGTITSGQYTPAGLALMAAELDLNAQNIDLVGLATTGLVFEPLP